MRVRREGGALYASKYREEEALYASKERSLFSCYINSS
jgi:hypothetical protein